MATQLRQKWQGTDDEARRETFGGGRAHWLSTPFPRSELFFSGCLAVAAVAVVPLLWSRGAASATAFGVFLLVFAGFCAAPAIWTRRHPDLAGRHLAAASRYNTVRWRKHPLAVAGVIVVFGFVNGFARFHDHGMAGRLIAGAASAGFAAIVSCLAIWHARRTGTSGVSNAPSGEAQG